MLAVNGAGYALFNLEQMTRIFFKDGEGGFLRNFLTRHYYVKLRFISGCLVIRELVIRSELKRSFLLLITETTLAMQR